MGTHLTMQSLPDENVTSPKSSVVSAIAGAVESEASKCCGIKDKYKKESIVIAICTSVAVATGPGGTALMMTKIIKNSYVGEIVVAAIVATLLFFIIVAFLSICYKKYLKKILLNRRIEKERKAQAKKDL